MQLDTVAAASNELAATAARGAKVAQLAALLTATESKQETAVVVSWLSGELTQRQIGVGWASVRDVPDPAAKASLAVLEVERVFTALGDTAGPGSQTRRRQLLDEVFTAATEREQQFLRRVLTGELRQGALAGVMTDAVAKATGIALVDVRRAAMLSGDLAEVAAAALHDGAAAIAGYTLQPGRPISPMLAQTAAGTEEALSTLTVAAFEWKLDGVRVQIHKSGIEIAIFTRTLDEVTDRLPEVVAAVRALPVAELVADGEVIALAADDRPRPFQVTSARLASRKSTELQLTTYIFDVLHLDGADLLDQPAQQRREALDRTIPATGPLRATPRLVTDDPAAAAAFLADALSSGHEGVIAKSLTATYQAGRRGAGWLKIKPVHTLDLVVLAVEWGSGRRKGRLSNIHLGARDPASGEFVMLGKTFKGMTDAMLLWQTERFLSLAEGATDGWVVRVRPTQVVEIAFDGVQTSSRYPGGVALRFARVLRYRDDKTADQTDTINTVRAFRPD
ncbi:MAG: ATP-dependent DNA ligase [Actinomycetota bacterium]|nr:ATP-dependent DNA ligase [Actinomycetota bacterium]MDQ2957740.1 ATP-dependent DNA ligase [Actinomycetota bacterium]